MMLHNPFPPTVYSLFLRGFDTAQIAKIRAIGEPEALRILTEERSASKSLPVETRHSPYQSSPIKRWLDRGRSGP